MLCRCCGSVGGKYVRRSTRVDASLTVDVVLRQQLFVVLCALLEPDELRLQVLQQQLALVVGRCRQDEDVLLRQMHASRRALLVFVLARVELVLLGGGGCGELLLRRLHVDFFFRFFLLQQNHRKSRRKSNNRSRRHRNCGGNIRAPITSGTPLAII